MNPANTLTPYAVIIAISLAAALVALAWVGNTEDNQRDRERIRLVCDSRYPYGGDEFFECLVDLGSERP